MMSGYRGGTAFISLQRPLKVQLQSVKADRKLFFVRVSFAQRSGAKTRARVSDVREDPQSASRIGCVLAAFNWS